MTKEMITNSYSGATTQVRTPKLVFHISLDDSEIESKHCASSKKASSHGENISST